MTKDIFWRDVAFPGGVADFRSVGDDGLIVPHGPTAGRPVSPINGTIRYDSTLGETQLYQSGTWAAVQTTAIGGEVNTVSNLGSGQGVFSSKSGVDLRFKSLVAGSNVSIGSNSNEIIISAATIGEINTGANMGIGTGNVFLSKFGAALQFRTLRSQSGGLTIADNGNQIDFTLTGGAAGEVNTASSVGTGSSVYKDKVSSNLRFRSIIPTTDQLSATQNTDDITLGIASNPILPGTGSMKVPLGTTAQAPTAANGMIRYDTDLNQLRAVVSGAWTTVSTVGGTFLPLGGGTMTGNLVLAGGADIVGGAGSTLSLQDSIILTGASAHLDMSAGGNILLQTGATVGGRDLETDGDVIDTINQTGSFGMVSRISDPGTFEIRTLTGTADQISVVDGDGVTGDPTFALADNPAIPGNSRLKIPTGTTAERPLSPTTGDFRFNLTTGKLELFGSSNWFSPVATLNGVVVGDLDMGNGNINNVGLLNGEDINSIATIVGDLSGLTNDAGVLTKTGGSITQQLITPSTLGGEEGVIITGGDGSTDITIGYKFYNRTLLDTPAVDDLLLIYDASEGTNVPTRVSDVIGLFEENSLNNSIDVVGQFGLIARTADGASGEPGVFTRRSIVSNTTNAYKGLLVTNGSAISGNPTVGLDIKGLTLAPASGITDDVQIIGYNPANDVNAKASIGSLRSHLIGALFKASATNTALVNGTAVVAVTIGVSDYNTGNYFTGNTFTPPAGTYRIGAYMECDSGTDAGTYTAQFQVDGVASGNKAFFVVDGTNSSSIQLEDLFVANGTTTFKLQVTNSSGSASTFPVIRFHGTRIY